MSTWQGSTTSVNVVPQFGVACARFAVARLSIALPYFGLAWERDSPLPDGGHRFGALIDNDGAVAEFSSDAV